MALTLLLLVPPAAAKPRHTAIEGLALTALPTGGVAPLLVRFYLTVPSWAPPNLSWSFGDGQYLNGTAPSDDTPAHTYDSSGTFQCQVTLEWSTGSVNASTMILVRPTNLSVTALATPGNGTYPLTVWLNATVRGGTGTYVAFYWSFGDGNRGSGLSVRYTYAAPGRYQANFTATDTNGRSATASTTVVATAPVPPDGGGSPSGGSWSLLTTVLVVLALGAGGIAGSAVYLGTRRWRSGAVSAPPGAPVNSLEGPGGLGPAPRPPEGALASPMAMPSPPPMPSAGPPALSTPSRITDALLLHLVGLPKLYPSDIPTRSWTQAGIAEEIGAGQSAVSRILRRLVAAGVVTVETRHVAGSPRRVRIYRLTDRGERLGRALRETPAPGRRFPPD